MDMPVLHTSFVFQNMYFIHCNTLQHTATHIAFPSASFTATHCNTLQHTRHFYFRICILEHVYALLHTDRVTKSVVGIARRCVAVCCSALQCVRNCKCKAVCCSVLQCFVVNDALGNARAGQCVVVCCSMLQCVPVNKVSGNARVGQCVVVCCRVLQYVAVCSCE